MEKKKIVIDTRKKKKSNQVTLDEVISESEIMTPKEKQPEGLGDVVEKVLDKTGIGKVAKWLLGEDCGCEKRKEYLNKEYPIEKPKCLNENEFIWLGCYFERNAPSITDEEQRVMLVIHNRIFNENREFTTCSPCVLSLHEKLEKIFKLY